MGRAFYDFSVSPFSYDFLAFICQAKAYGCTETVFVPGEREYQKCTPEEQEFRLHNLLIPLAWMGGDVHVCTHREAAKALEPAVFPIGYTVDKPVHGHMFGQLIRGGKARWLEPSRNALEAAGAFLGARTPVTITIRESRIKPLRNSNIREWVKAAEWMRDEGLDPIFVPDTDNMQSDFGGFDTYPEASLKPDVRLALYTKSRMNLGIGNGPMGLCFYSKLPYMMFRMFDERCGHPETSAAFLTANNLPPGSQAPWAVKGQKIVWEDDTADVIIKHLKEWRGDLNVQ